MKWNQNQQIIIEFAGLPGSGKSTLTKRIISVLEKEYNIIRRKDISETINKIWDSPLKTFLFFIYCLLKPKHLSMKLSLVRFILSFPLKQKGIIYSIYLIKLYELIHSSKNHSNVIIMDEGIIQFISSISHDEPIKENEIFFNLIKKMGLFSEKILFIEIKANITDVMNRIKKRNQKDRFCYNENLELLLRTKQNNIITLINGIATNKLELDMKSSIDINVQLILNRIKSGIK